MEGDSAAIPDSHLSFIFKEKQQENEVARPRWEFLSELTEENKESFFLFDTPLGSTGSTGSAIIGGNTRISMSTPNLSSSVSIGNASAVVSFVKSHQNILSTLFNPNIIENEGTGNAFARGDLDESQFIAQANVDGTNRKRPFFWKSRKQDQPEPTEIPAGTTRILAHGSNKNDLWIDFFGEKLKFAPEAEFNTIHNTCLGFIVGYDRFLSSGMVTGAIGYNHSKISEAGHVGHGHLNQIFGLFQGTAYLPKMMYLGYSLYGSVNLNNFHRFVDTGAETEVAKSSFTSYTLDPHLDFGYDWCVNDWFIVEPFISNDFLFNFQPSYSEHGAPGFNEHQNAVNSGLYVVEPGVNLYQRLDRNWGLVVLRQEVGYERAQTMFGTNNTVSIIDVQDGISIPTGLRDMNLFVFGFQVFTRANNGFYGDLLYRGEFGPDLIANTLHLKLGRFF
jgi:hypothetical protein